MNRIILIFVVVICFGLIGWGIIQKGWLPEILNEKNSTEEPLMEIATQGGLASDTAPIISTTNKEVKRYYPDGMAFTEEAEDIPTDEERDFQITPALLTKMHLADKYNPGVCFGSPASPPAVAITSLVDGQPALSSFLRQQYNLSSDLEVYNKIRQYQNITLIETASSQFKFSFMDGQCSTLVYYEGTVKVSGAQVTDIVTSRQSHTAQ